MTLFLKSNTPIDPSAVVAKYSAVPPNAVIDLNYTDNSFYYDGAYYASVAEIIAAGFGAVSGGVQTLMLPTLGSAFSLYGSGICGASTGYMFTLEDDSDGDPADNFVACSQNGVIAASFISYSGSASQVNFTAGAGSADADDPISYAARLKLNDVAVSFNKTVVQSDADAVMPVGLTTLVIGNRGDGARTWAGTIGRITIINADLTDAQLVALPDAA